MKTQGHIFRDKVENMVDLMDDINEFLVQKGVKSNKALEIKDMLDDLFYLISLE